MRNSVLAAVGLAALAMASWTATPAKAIPLSAPAALKSASDTVKLTETVHCDCDEGYGSGYGYGYGYRHHYRSYYRPYYRSYSDYNDGYYERPYYRNYYRPYRPYYRSYWSGGDGWYARPRYFYFGPSVYYY